MNFIRVGFFFFVGFIFVSCQYSGEQTRAESPVKINGTYTFKYPSGEVEVVCLNEDSTYKRMLYKNEVHYSRKHNPQFLNEGTWRANEKAILFNDWMQYCYLMNPDSILREPEMVESQYADLYPATQFGNAVIVIWEDTNYILHKEN